jgi:sRNA-binding carbon storage regulator CsrA
MKFFGSGGLVLTREEGQAVIIRRDDHQGQIKVTLLSTHPGHSRVAVVGTNAVMATKDAKVTTFGAIHVVEVPNKGEFTIDEVVVSVSERRSGRARLVFKAPRNYQVLREEIA